jgi:serine/threonine protein kinase
MKIFYNLFKMAEKKEKYIKRLGDLKLISYIGHGGNTMGVFKGLIKLKNKNTGSFEEIDCVAKSFSNRQFRDEGFKTRYEREKEIGLKLSHPNIVKTFGEIKSKNNTYLIMEYANGGDLKSFLEYTNRSIEDLKIRIFLRQILSGILYLHENSIMNRDVKLENVLLHFYDQEIYYKKDFKGKLIIAYEKQDYEKCQLKICDLGFSKSFIKEDNIQIEHTILGTNGSMPKEIDSGIYDETFDFWSLGILILYLLEGFTEKNTQDSSEIQIKKEIIYSIELREILDFLLKDDPQDRKACVNLLKLDFFIKDTPTYVDSRQYEDCEEIRKLFQINKKDYTDYHGIFSKLIKK